MSRIIAGAAGGLTLSNVSGDATRPTTDRVKESVFSRLEHWDAFAGASVLDLFAGSGALGLEAMSRGAHQALLVDAGSAAVKVSQTNAKRVGKAIGRPDAIRVLKGKAPSVLSGVDGEWDLVFLDPPYPMGEDELAHVLEVVAGRLRPGAVVVIERSSRSPEPSWPAGLAPISEKKYGETRIHYAEPGD
ncbi:16S rRNA (guanine(966)-N(2))-methyltransferase RsmD [Zhihengliuella halotolerans]|uniref:16S rRNA (guanine(966)-N(2))-methyltransferase RsmD n=1 Tax=Zhihengliuella halotolerans TaxID=370736 RepID=UPI000C80A0C1|nr:16S rRNA (guanine(966)-N(2))-methyltransferase RsmD [Zhihengliuella halotolerans]